MIAISKVLQVGLPITKASKALLLLHGRGATAEGILSLSDKLCGNDFYIAAPQATNNAWYPHSFMEKELLNEPYLSSSVEAIQNLIDQIGESIPKESIVIAGFSQGACLALEVCARSAVKYGGIIAFTGGLIGKSLDEKKYLGDFKKTNVFISNGDKDPYIPLKRSQESQKLMEKMGAQVTLKVYEKRPHIVSEDELALAKKIIFSS